MPITMKKSSMKYKNSSGSMQEVGLPVGSYETDSSLTRQGIPADAKAVGDEFSNYYEKSDTYSKTEFDSKLSSIPKFKIEVVNSLPTSNISSTTVYLVKSGNETQNLYTEYIYVNNAWEYLGKQSVDLTGYALKTDVPTKLSKLTNDSGFVTANHDHIYYGVCSTEAGTLDKTVEINGFALKEGAIVVVKFTNANSIASPTLNVSGTGAKPIYRYGTTTVSTGTTTTGWIAGAVQWFIYDGTGWIRDYWNNSTYSNASLGSGYATCSTAAATVAKVCTLSSYTLTVGGIVSVKFTYDVPANATLNINTRGAKNIVYRGKNITADVIKASDIATFIYDGTQYHLLSIDRWQDDIKNMLVGLNASKVVFDTPAEDVTFIDRGTLEDALLSIEHNISELNNNKVNKNNYETWTFTLEDGSTVTKKVVLT